MPIVVALCNLLSELLSPQRDQNCPENVGIYKEEYGYCERKVVEVCGKNDRHHKAFCDGGQQPEKEVLHQGVARRNSTIHRPNDLAAKAFYYNKMPLGPIGCAVQMHSSAGKRKT